MRDLVHELDHSMPAAQHAQLGTLLQALITAHNTGLQQQPLFFTAALTPAAVGANTTAEQIFVVTGVAVGDFVDVNKPSAQAGIGIVGARVSSANHVGITFNNHTGGAITPTAGETYTFGVLRPTTALQVQDLVTAGLTAA